MLLHKRTVSERLISLVSLCVVLIGGTSFACTAAARLAETDLAGNRLDTLTVVQKTLTPEKGCTAGSEFCIELQKDTDDTLPQLRVTRIGANVVDIRFSLTSLTEDASNRGNFTLWPYVIRLADECSGILAGVAYSLTEPYSGGSAYASELRLVSIVPDGVTFKMQEVLAVPLSGESMIRACFSERDMRRRLGACHDEYTFNATLHLDHAVRSGFPRLLYSTRATSFPGHVSRSKDSSDAPPLRKHDLVTVVDPQCSYRRSFRFDRSSSSYVPNRPLPKCDNYTVP